MSEPEAAPLRVALDLRHPFSYLALRPAIALGRELGIGVDWRPLRGQPLRPPSEPAPDDDRSVRHKRHRAHMIAREIAVYAEAQGLTVREPYRDAPADAANLAWLWVRARQPQALEDFLEELFRRYWALELDPGDLQQAAAAVDAFGLDADAFRTWAAQDGPAVADAVAEALLREGLLQSPAYRVEDEVFFGRQHLPMIRWILGGRRGPGPI